MNVGPFLIMFAAALWAVDALIRTPLTTDIPAASIVFLEHVVGFLLLSPLFLRSRGMFRKLIARDWVTIVMLTIVSSVGGTLLFTEALARSFTSGDFITPLLLQKTQPLFVIVLSAIVLKERLTPRFLLLSPIALIGSYLMSFGFMPISLQFVGKELVFVLALGAAAAWGSGTILSKTILTKLTYIESTVLRFLMAIPIGFIAAAMLGQLVHPAVITSAHLGRFVLIGLTTGAGALLVYYMGLARTEAKVSTISELTFPLVSVLIGLTALNPYGAPQTLSMGNIVGIVLLVGAMMAISIEHARASATHTFAGVVVRGAGDGKKLGFPTMNITPDEAPRIRYGVYACIVTVGKKTHDGVFHFGPRIVYGERKPQYEVHVFDFKKNVYGKRVTVEVRDFIRTTMHFTSTDALVAQMHQDVARAKAYLHAS